VTTNCGVRLIKIQELLLMHVYFGKGYSYFCSPAPEEGALDIFFESGEESVDPLNS
jgi:hypothetical protein